MDANGIGDGVGGKWSTYSLPYVLRTDQGGKLVIQYSVCVVHIHKASSKDVSWWHQFIRRILPLKCTGLNLHCIQLLN